MLKFFVMFKRLNSNVVGIVNGSSFKNGKLPFAYLGRGEKADKGSKLLIYGEKIDDYVFGKEDVISCNIIGTNVYFKSIGNKQMIGNRYDIKFKDGKSAIISIAANDTRYLEDILF